MVCVLHIIKLELKLLSPVALAVAFLAAQSTMTPFTH